MIVYDTHEDMPIPSSSKQLCCWNDSMAHSATYQPYGHLDDRSPISPLHNPLLTPTSSQWHTSPLLEPLFDDFAMDCSGDDELARAYDGNSRAPPDTGKPRVNSLDSSETGLYDFMAPPHPPRSRTMQPSSAPFRLLQPLLMDTTEHPISQSPASFLNIMPFDSSPHAIEDLSSPTYLDSPLSCPEVPLPELPELDELSISRSFDDHQPILNFVPESPHSPNMELSSNDDIEVD